MEPTQKGKQFTIADDKGPTTVLLRSKIGLFISGAYEESLQDKTKIFGHASFMLQTKNGEYIIAGSQTKVITYNTKTNSMIFEGDFNYIYSMTLSPNEKYIQILDKINTNDGKTMLFELPQMNLAAQFQENQHSNYFSKQSYPLIRFSSDDQNYFRYVSKLLEVYDSTHKKIKQLKTGPLQFFQVSKISTQDNYVIACLYLDKKKNDGQCELFKSGIDQPIYKKHIKKAEEIKVKFSPTSNKFLMELQTYYDPTGKSYYGQYGLYLFNDQTNKISRIKTQNGPVHDFSWHQSGQKFIVISGFMPATSVLYNKQNQKIFQFGKKHRNQIYWGKLGRFVCLAGFGNLSGEMQIWDLQTLKQLGFCKSNSASFCQWSHDDRKIMTSIVTPRLRVDNCYKTYSYTGTYLKKVNFDHTQLYDARWFNIGYNSELKSRGLSPNRKIQVQQKKDAAKFKSFGASLNFDGPTLKQPSKSNQPKLAPGQHPQDLYPKKKRKRKNHKQPDLGV